MSSSIVRSVARCAGAGPCRRLQQQHRLAEPGGHLMHRQRAAQSGQQLHRQRQAVHVRAYPPSRGEVRRVRGPSAADRLQPLQEQLYRVRPHRQRSDVEDRLPGYAQRDSAGGDDPHVRAAAQQRSA
ncbi:hypothetical protein [Dactylosporangium sp. CA-139066]|uniref:hypothetical protein n=1 Tax=Dactylosporangium sp. CA-139066 TaxID=3239930 RepID=UPI003D8CC333